MASVVERVLEKCVVPREWRWDWAMVVAEEEEATPPMQRPRLLSLTPVDTCLVFETPHNSVELQGLPAVAEVVVAMEQCCDLRCAP